MLLRNCQELDLQNMEIGMNGETLQLEEACTLETLKLKLVELNCVFDGIRPAPKICHINRLCRDSTHEQMFVDKQIDLSQATDIKLSLTDRECSDA